MHLRLSPRYWKIKAKSVALVGGYALTLCAVYGAFTMYLLRREATVAQGQFQQTGRIVAAEFDAYIESGRSRLATVAELPGMTYGLRTIQETKGRGRIAPWTTLHYLFFKSRVFTGGAFLLDRTGTVLWTEPPGLPWLGQNLADYAPFAAVFQTRHGLISGALPADLILDRPHAVVADPVENVSGEIEGVLGGVIDLTAPQVTDMLKEVSTADGRFVEVIDQNGMVVASTTPTRLFQPAEVFAQNAHTPIVASVDLADAPWRVMTGQPRAMALAQVAQFQRLLMALGVSLLLAALAVGIPFVGGLVRSIEKLTESAKVMARGDLSQRVDIGTRYDETATLAETFEQMRVELNRTRNALEQRLEEREDLIRLKEHFLANISHELRTPLNAIVGYTEILSEEALSAEGREFVATIRTQSEHLAQLLTDLLTLSTANVGRLTLQVSPVRLPNLVARLSPLVERLHEGKEVDVIWDCPASVPPIETDPLRLEQVLTNLLTNAFKFTAKGTVAICARHAVEQGRVIFEIMDTGIGISASEIPHIFDEFRQVDGSYSRSYSGVGLGLALAKKLTLLLQGEITVASQVGHGSTFTVSIPLRMAPVPAPPEENSEEPSAAGAVSATQAASLSRRMQPGLVGTP